MNLYLYMQYLIEFGIKMAKTKILKIARKNGWKNYLQYIKRWKNKYLLQNIVFNKEDHSTSHTKICLDTIKGKTFKL